MDFAFGIIVCIIGVLVIMYGKNCIKTSEETAKIVVGGSADTYRQVGRNAIRFGIFIIVGGIIGAIVINLSTSSLDSPTPTYAHRQDSGELSNDYNLTCKSCGRTFENTSSDAKSIRSTNMCSQCYKNYKYAVGE